MMDFTMDTYGGQLTSSPVSEDNLAYVKFLEGKILILEDIVNTSHIIAELREAALSKQLSEQTVKIKSDIGVQTDLADVGQITELHYDSLQEIPNSYLLTDSVGVLEFPESMLSVNVDSYSEIVDPCTGAGESYGNFSSISSAGLSEESSLCSLLSSISSDNVDITVPVEMISEPVFGKFSMETLLSELEMTHHFSNRSSVYFGEFDYNYGKISHQAKDVSEKSYLSAICSYMDVLFPNYEYNSVLINLYDNGSDYIPPHSDNEESIEDDSYIVTISLGATRTLQFTEISSGSIVDSIEPGHGDVFIMSKSSQYAYRHELIQDPLISGKRISLTFRLIKPEVPLRSPVKCPIRQSRPEHTQPNDALPFDSETEVPSVGNDSGYVPFGTLPSRPSFPTYRDKMNQQYCSSGLNSEYHPDRVHTSYTQHVDSLYISSSIFRDLNPDKLSSDTQSSQVLFYPGATSSQMLQRLLCDPSFISINKTSVKRIFLLTGTNYVDSISSGSVHISTAKSEIDHLCCSLWELMPNAKINVINLLPRESDCKNSIVNELNYFIKCMCGAHGLNYVDTEHRIRLFTTYSDGTRENKYFRSRYDDVHLNKYGISRLAKHLKYLAHNYCYLEF